MDLPSVMRLAELGDFIIPLTLRAICDLGIADLLTDGPEPVEKLAAAVDADAATLARLLRALAAKGIFTEVEPGTFGLTALAQPLRSDHPLSLRDVYTLLASDLQAWAALPHSVRTGEPAFDRVHGTDYWSYLADHLDESVRVDRWMHSINRLHLRTVLPAYPWAELSHVVDVGGGNGGFLAGLLSRFRTLRGTLFDLPHVVAGAEELLAEAGVRDRCVVTPGSFFDSVPAGADAYLLKTVLPGFTDPQVTTVLGNLRAAMPAHGRVLLLEAVLPAGDTYDVAKLFDVHTLVLTGGRHRTAEETERLCRAAGLRLAEVRPTPTLTVLDLRPA
ncbi:methyltransferase [Micromonospora sp. R77]|uniref:methyltransferase n=1 Tax=Micromonospora sp. R77 TaxID=2925836 RepID=UPI001F60E81E|nr:methyltransferase [Micromonospora sp. R77]MCI4066426.1 methyltransferase [Micromonospora sp. R77]